MRRTEAHQGVQLIRFKSVFERYEAADAARAKAVDFG